MRWSRLGNWRWFWIVMSVAINRLCSMPFIPKYYYFDPFPMYDIVNEKGQNVGLTLQSYIYDLSFHFVFICFWISEICRAPEHRKLFFLFLGIEGFSLIDYLVRYEKSFTMIGMYPLEFTDIKILLYIALIVLRKRIQK